MLKLPAGKYYIGDPCYVFNDDTWQRLLNSASLDGDIVEFDGHQIWGHSTMFGDGEYPDQNGNEFSVDSGILAAIPIELIDNPAGEEDGVVIESTGLIVEYQNGTFWFGSICIETNGSRYEDFEVDDLDPGYDGDLDSEFRFDA